MKEKEVLYARVEVFLSQFPFLDRYVKIHRFSYRPRVERVDLDLLERSGHTYEWSSVGYPHSMMGECRFYLLNADGRELRRVKPYDHTRSRPFRIWQPSTWFCEEDIEGETVLEAIRGMYDPDKMAYILEIHDLLCSSRSPDHDPDFGLKVILHKIPAGRSFSEWVSQIRETARTELQGELAKVDGT